jgi:hypothetical protein
MAQTLAQIETELRATYPQPQYVMEGSVRRQMTTAEYNAWISQQAISTRDQQLAAEADAVRRAALQASIDKLTPLLAKLQAVPAQNLTTAETKTVLTEVVAWALPKIIAEKEAGLV